jgi:predicted DNA-binding protein with PD1-like motif
MEEGMNTHENNFELKNEKEFSKAYKSSLTCHVLRMLPDTDLYQELKNYLKKNGIQAATIISCVGSLKKIHIRTATGKNFLKYENNYEIVSLVGCVSIDRSHIHISLGDSEGKTISGHLMGEGNIVFTTAELVLGELNDLKFSQEECQLSGWPELKMEYQN